MIDVQIQKIFHRYPVYDILNGLDTGFPYISASELRTKLVSRQAMLVAAGEKDVNFTQTDVIPSLCAGVNEVHMYEQNIVHKLRCLK